MNYILEKNKLSFLIITLNEEKNLTISLKSIRKYFSDVNILVLDSFSTDQTKHVSVDYNAHFVQNKFVGYANQRNFGIQLLEKYEWVFMLDADEEITSDFAEGLFTCLSLISSNYDIISFRRKDYFLNTWIKRSSGYPTWFGRIVRTSNVKVKREVNEEYLTDNDTYYLKCHINHYPFNRGVEHWVHKHNYYSSLESSYLFSKDNITFKFLLGTPQEQRIFFKSIYLRLPLRPFFTLFYLYLFRFGILDGKAGFYFCLLRFFYEIQIDLKTIEKQNSA